MQPGSRPPPSPGTRLLRRVRASSAMGGRYTDERAAALKVLAVSFAVFALGLGIYEGVVVGLSLGVGLSLVFALALAGVLLVQRSASVGLSASVLMLVSLGAANWFIVWSRGAVVGAELCLVCVLLLPLALFPRRSAGVVAAWLLGIVLNFLAWTWVLGTPAREDAFASSLPRDTAVVLALGLIAVQLRRVRRSDEEEVEVVREYADHLIHDIVPQGVAAALKAGNRSMVRLHGDVTVLVVYVDGFDELSEQLWPGVFARLMTELRRRLTKLCKAREATFIKAFGDAYLAAVGLEHEREDHAEVAAQLALDMLESVASYNERTGGKVQLRIGMDSGPVIAGAIGGRTLSYDLWGHAVLRASALATYGIAMRVQISELAHARIRHRYRCEAQEDSWMSEQGLGSRTYWLVGPRGAGLERELGESEGER